MGQKQCGVATGHLVETSQVDFKLTVEYKKHVFRKSIVMYALQIHLTPTILPGSSFSENKIKLLDTFDPIEIQHI